MQQVLGDIAAIQSHLTPFYFSGYPCYRNLMKVTGLDYVSIAVNKEFKVTAVELEQEVLRRKQTGLKRLKGSTFHSFTYCM